MKYILFLFQLLSHLDVGQVNLNSLYAINIALKMWVLFLDYWLLITHIGNLSIFIKHPDSFQCNLSWVSLNCFTAQFMPRFFERGRKNDQSPFRG